MSHQLMAYGKTDIGKVRDNNEDYFLIVPERNLYIISDGMGGHRAGEVASRIASEAIRDYFLSRPFGKEFPEDMLLASIRHADALVQSAARVNADYAGMGCTIVVCCVVENTLYTCHVGDSRGYIIDSSSIHRITEDHSMVAQLIKAKKMTEVEARSSLLRNQLTQALGSLDSEVLKCTKKQLSPGDVVLLCTDGLWEHLQDKEIFTIVNRAKDMPQACDNLIKKAINAGGYDNIAVVLATYDRTKGYS